MQTKPGEHLGIRGQEVLPLAYEGCCSPGFQGTFHQQQ
jgi:hypothetical protein